MADKAYSSAANRAWLRKRGIAAVIPVKEDQKMNRRARGRSGGRPPAFDPGRCKERNTVERCFSKLKQFRAVATRYDKRDYMYQATIDIALDPHLATRSRFRDLGTRPSPGARAVTGFRPPGGGPARWWRR